MKSKARMHSVFRVVSIQLVLCLLLALAGPALLMAASEPEISSSSGQETTSDVTAENTSVSEDVSVDVGEGEASSMPDSTSPENEGPESPESSSSEPVEFDPSLSENTSSEPAESQAPGEEEENTQQNSAPHLDVADLSGSMVVEAAKQDGAAVAQLLNGCEDDVLYETLLREVLNLYYAPEQEADYTSHLVTFVASVDERAGDILAAYAAAAQERATNEFELGYLPGSVLVSFKQEVTESQAEVTLEQFGGSLESTVDTLDPETLTVVEIALDKTVSQAVEEYNQMPNVSCAQPVYVYQQAATVPNDTYYSNQWHFDKINALEAWDLLPNKGAGNEVRVAVIDSQIQTNHPDLVGSIDTAHIKRFDRSSGQQTAVVSAYNHHATHVAGIIAAQANNNMGVAGVGAGWNNNVIKIMAIDSFYKSSTTGEVGASTTAVIAGIDYAIKNGAKVINLSLGTPPTSLERDEQLHDAIKSAVNSGVTVVCAAGNDGSTATYYPGDFDEAINVINLNNTTYGLGTNPKDIDSNYGSKKDLSAPGTSIPSTINAGGYGNISGTSMASPIVAAVAAMIYYVEPNITPAVVRSILTETATDLYIPGKDDQTGYGCVNAAEAVKETLNMAVVTSVTPNSWEMSSANNIVVNFNRAMDTSSPGVVYLGNTALSGGTWSLDNTRYTVQRGAATGNTVTVTGFKGSGGSICPNYTTVPLQSISISPASYSLWKGQMIGLQVNALPVGCTDQLTITWNSTNPSVASVSGGWVTANTGGSTIISATVAGRGVYAGCNITAYQSNNLTEAFLERLYLSCFNRYPDTEGMRFWTNEINTNPTCTGASVVEYFFMNDEFTNAGHSQEEYVRRLYTTVMNRQADAGGLQYWLGCLESGNSRYGVLRIFMHTEEFAEVCSTYGVAKGSLSVKENRDENLDVTAFVYRQYSEILKRPGEVEGLNFWCGRIMYDNMSPHLLSESFVFSDEFEQQNYSDEEYVKILYRAFMGREFDQTGLNHWLNGLRNNTYSRRDVFNHFAGSAEFSHIVKSYGL